MYIDREQRPSVISPTTCVVAALLHLAFFAVLWFCDMIHQIAADTVAVRILKPQMVVESAGPVDQKVAETVKMVAGDNKQFLPAARSIEESEQGGLVVVIVVIIRLVVSVRRRGRVRGGHDRRGREPSRRAASDRPRR